MDSIVEEFGPIPTEDPTSQSKGKDEDETDPNKGKDGEEKKTQPGPVKKRKNSGGGGGSGKKIKVDGSKIKTIESVGTAGAILDVPLVNAKIQGVHLHIKAGSKIYVFNQGSQEANLKAGLILCGYGQGKWRLQTGTENEGNPTKEVLFNIDGPETMVPWSKFLLFPCTLL